MGDNPSSVEDGVPAIRLLIVDDQPRVRQGLGALFTAFGWGTPRHTKIPIRIVGEAHDGQQVVEQLQTLYPDVVVLDLPTHDTAKRVSLSDAEPDGLAVIRTIKQRWPHVRVVVLTMYATDRSAVLLAGADVFLLKGCPMSELLAAVMPA